MRIECECRFLKWSVGITALALAVGAAVAADEPVPLVLRGDNAVIVDGTTYAGKYLQWALLKCVAKAADADQYEPGRKPRPDRAASKAFPLYTARQAGQLRGGRNVIAIGKTPHLTDADRARLKEHVGAVVMRRDGNVVIVAGETPHDPWQGEMAAMSLFLNRVCGVRFYAPDPLWWSMPPKPEVVVGNLDVFHKPHLAKTTWSGAWHANYPHRWDRLNKSVSGGSTLRANHALAQYFPPRKYYHKSPQIYEQKGDKRPKPQGGAWNPCLSAKELPDVALAEIRERLRKRPGTRYLSFGVMDCKFDCHCEACQASVRRHGGSYSNLYYTFLNEVARRCRKEFPGLCLTAYIYANVGRPPEGMRIEPNIVVDYVSKTYRWVDPAWARAAQRDILAWARLGAGWVVHDWSFAGLTPRAYTRQFARFLQWGCQHGMKGLYIEWTHYDAWYLDGARYWIVRQLETDPYQDVDALWRQYCDDMYGAGGEHMYRLFQHFADKHTYADRYCELEDWPKREFALYTEDDLAYQRTLIAQAREATKDDAAVRRRFEQLLPWFRRHELWVQAVGEPSRLAHRHQGDGVNDAALAFYLGDDGTKLERAIASYRTMHETDDPAARKLYQQFYLLPAYAHNYSRGLGQILLPIRRQALAGVDLMKAGERTPQRLLERSRELLRKHLPPTYRRESLRRIESLFEKALWVPRATTMPELDGRLDDAAWRDAAELKDFTIRAVLLPSRHQTSGKVVRVGDRLVFGLRCQQAGPIWASTPPAIETGTRIWRESGVEFFFAPVEAEAVGQPTPKAQYIVNALGAWRGFGLAEGNRENVNVAVRLDKEAGRYVIEAAFPLKAKGYDLAGERVLSFNLMRNVFTSDSFHAIEILGWAPVLYTAHRADSRGLLFLKPTP